MEEGGLATLINREPPRRESGCYVYIYIYIDRYLCIGRQRQPLECWRFARQTIQHLEPDENVLTVHRSQTQKRTNIGATDMRPNLMSKSYGHVIVITQESEPPKTRGEGSSFVSLPKQDQVGLFFFLFSGFSFLGWNGRR